MIMALTPTLWRTARVLSGPVRLALLRSIFERPGQTVSELAAAMELSRPRASQELRRIQARGLVQVVRSGRFVMYRPVPDPKVRSAKPLLAAMKSALTTSSQEETIRVARAFGHDRRLSVVRALMNGPKKATELQVKTGISALALYRHLRTLKEGGVVQAGKRGWILAPNPHPLTKCMVGLLRRG